ncbi:tetratricopeptide repeat protein [Kordia sp.]|uniref:tetratricopeptide repeat protein n=1 Tax=Kordia sp. TaxID=1965332 RepID=UPI003D6B7C85
MKHYYLIFFFLIFYSCDFITEEEYYSRALNHEDKRDYQGAIVLLDKAIARKPDYKDAFIFRGYCKAQMGNIKESTVDYLKALKLEPNNTMILFNLAINYNDISNFEEGIKYYTKALESKYLKTCDATTEETLLEIVSPFDNSNETGYEIKVCELYYWRGISYYKNKEYDAAIRDLKEAIKVNFNKYEAYYYLGEIYLKKEDFQNACKNFSLAADIGNAEAVKKMKELCQNKE